MWVKVILCLISLPLLGATDYSKCAEFLNNPSNPHDGGKRTSLRWHDNGPFLPGRFRSLPFDMETDGALKPHDGVSFDPPKRLSDGSTETTYTYKDFPLKLLEDRNGYFPPKKRTKEVKVVVKRDSNGNITEIFEDQNLSAGEKNAFKAQGKDGDLYYAYTGTRTTFEVKDGQCVPVMAREELLRKGADGKDVTTRTVTFSTSLCREIKEVIDDHPNLQQCFSSTANSAGKKIQDLFAKHWDEILNAGDGFKPFLSPEKRSGLTKKAFDSDNSSKRHAVELQMMTGYIAGSRFEKLENGEDVISPKIFGHSPVVSGFMALENCEEDQRLRPFLGDDSIWEAPASPPSPSSGDSTL